MRAGTEAARGYAEILEDVNGFALGGGWHGIALGPYTRADAETALLPYHRDGLIPRVAVIAESSSLRQQFWPVGANILDLEVAPAPIEAETQIVDADETPTAEPTSLVEVELVEPAGETPAEAQRSKGALSREEKKNCNVCYSGLVFTTQQLMGRSVVAHVIRWLHGKKQIAMILLAF